MSSTFEKKTRIVVIITAFTMVLEIAVGTWTNSMALLADGYHMASHVFALGITWMAYIITRKYATSEKFSFSTERFLSLTGFTSALLLTGFAVFVAWKAVEHLFNPVGIRFTEAIIVAIVGLLVNLASAFFLRHDHETHDHNIRAAYLHVLADALTSIAAIIAIAGAWIFGILWLDSAGGLISSVVILRWSYTLIKSSGKVLVDYKRLHVTHDT